jgi:Sugar (and other) transporter
MENSCFPPRRCYSEAVKNLSIDEVRKFYSAFPNPSCTNLDSQLEVQQDEAQLNWKSTSHIKREMLGGESSECKEWIYDFEFLFGYRSMTSELNWVCQNAWKSIMGQSTYFIGSVAGTLVLGILADQIGRLPVLIIAHLAGILGNGLTIFATDEITFSICR